MKTKKIIKSLVAISLSTAICMGAFSMVGCNSGVNSSESNSSSAETEKLISLNVYEKTVEEGENFSLIATVEGGGALVWTSSDASIATVDANGKVTALKQGKVDITVTCGEEFAICSLTVKEKTTIAPTFKLEIKTTSLYVGGSPIQLKPYITINGEVLTAQQLQELNIAYVSENSDIVEVSEDGKVTAKAYGSTTVKAYVTIDGVYFEDIIHLTVGDLIFIEPIVNIVVLASSKTIAGNDNTKDTNAQIGAKIFKGEQYEEVTGVTFTYESSNTDVVTVDENGKLTAVGEGEANITISYEDLTTSTSVSVGRAIASKADLDKLAYAYKDGNTSLWTEEASYVFVNDIDYAGAYFTPIAPRAPYTVGGQWGIFGELNSPAEIGTAFKGTIDGNGYTISNAVLPFGTIVDTNYGAWGNFIGDLDGTLKNIAFKNITTENAAQFLAAHPEYADVFKSGYDVVQYVGVVGVVNGRIENVYIDIEFSVAGIGNVPAGPIAVSGPNAVVKNCVTNVTATDYGLWGSGVVGRFWNGDLNVGYLSDIGLVVGTNNGTMENCFMVVENKTFKNNVGSDVPYRNWFVGSHRADWYEGANSTTGMGSGSVTNLVRYDSVSAFLEAQSQEFANYGFNTTYWTNWLA